MRSLFITTGLETGGAEHALLRLLPAMRSFGVESGVVSLGGPGNVGPRLEAHGVSVMALRLPSWGGLATALPRLARHVRRWRPDVIHGWMYHGNLAATLGARFGAGQVPVFWGIRQSLDDGNRDRWLTRRIIGVGALLSKSADHIVYNSTVAREHHAARGFADDRSTVVPNGIDTDEFAPDVAARDALRRELGVDESTTIVGHVARYHASKGHAIFLQAASSVRRHSPHAVFVLAGDGVDLGNRDLHALVRHLELEGRVHLLGRRDDMPRVMAAFDVLCLSSLGMEGFPNVIAEAMSCGVPCVASRVGDAPYLVGDTGTVVPPGDAPALATALEAMLRLATPQRRVLGSAARARIVRHFGIAEVARRYAELLAAATT